jgi:hypothetical protein
VGPSVRVVSAFQNISAHKLKKLDHKILCDVLVCSDDKDARLLVIGLAMDAGLKGINAGPLANSTVAESLTSVLIWINRTYKIPDAGIAITGLAQTNVSGGRQTLEESPVLGERLRRDADVEPNKPSRLWRWIQENAKKSLKYAPMH